MCFEALGVEVEVRTCKKTEGELGLCRHLLDMTMLELTKLLQRLGTPTAGAGEGILLLGVTLTGSLTFTVGLQ